uniref:C2H2-type domain-containing protein n=1 Tax=Macrostomum lignano TaxID=282301 RepID=A0A1I8F8J3_9PLAT
GSRQRAENNDPRCGKDFYSARLRRHQLASFQGYPSTVADRCPMRLDSSNPSCSAANISVFDVFPTAVENAERQILRVDELSGVNRERRPDALYQPLARAVTYAAVLCNAGASGGPQLHRGCPGTAFIQARQMRRGDRQSCSHMRPWYERGLVCSVNEPLLSNRRRSLALHCGVAHRLRLQGRRHPRLSPSVLICFLCQRSQTPPDERRGGNAGLVQTSRQRVTRAATATSGKSLRSIQRIDAEEGLGRRKSSLTDLEMTSVMSGPGRDGGGSAEPALKPILKLTFSGRSRPRAQPPLGFFASRAAPYWASLSRPRARARASRLPDSPGSPTTTPARCLDPAQPVRYTPAPGNSRLRRRPPLSPGRGRFSRRRRSHSGSAAAEDGYTRKNSYCKIVEEESDHRGSDSEGGGPCFRGNAESIFGYVLI